MGVDVDFLQQVPLFAELGERELAEVCRAFIERSYSKGEVIFAEEETGDYMYVVRSGRVKVSRWLPSGRELILAFHPAHDYFGEMSLIDGQTLPATVTAVEATTILSLSRQRFVALIQHPGFALSLLKELCQRCRDAWSQLEVLTHHHAEARIRLALRLLCRRDGTQTPEGVRVDMPLTHRDLASLAGVSRETVTRVLGQLSEDALIRIEDRRLLVPDPERLIEDSALD
jgi:CRP/FNR family cyclic AMP-dependent transcriptional regulator